MSMTTRATSAPDGSTVTASRAIADELPDGDIKIEGVAIPLPPQIAALLRDALASYAAGKSIGLVVRDNEMTPNEAAEYLNVSRGTVTRLIDEGVLPVRIVGTHKRIPTAAVEAYDVKQRAQSEAALTELVRLSQEMGLYDMDQRMPPREQATPDK
jgi:excisionase family DNA binding protein